MRLRFKYLTGTPGLLLLSGLFVSSALGQFAVPGSQTSLQRFLYQLPDNIEFIGKAYTVWNQIKADSSAAEEAKIDAMESLVNSIMMHDQQFMFSLERDSLDQIKSDEALEYYDKKVQLNLSWFLNFVESPTWEEIQSQLESHPWRQELWTETIRNAQDLREAQKSVYSTILKQVASIPEKLRRKFSERYLIYDDPPYPAGGYTQLQKSASQLGDPQNASEICLVKIDIATTGKLLRTSVTKSTGDAATDSTVMTLITSQTWQPATRRGEPFRSTVKIPIRVSVGR